MKIPIADKIELLKAKLFGTKIVRQDLSPPKGDRATEVTMHIYKGKIYVTNIKYKQ